MYILKSEVWWQMTCTKQCTCSYIHVHEHVHVGEWALIRETSRELNTKKLTFWACSPVMAELMTVATFSSPFRWWRLGCIPLWVWCALPTSTRFGDKWKRTNRVHVFSWTEWMNLLMEIPLSVGTQSLRRNNSWFVSIWSPALFQQLIFHFRCVTLLLGENTSRWVGRDSEMMHFLNAYDLLQLSCEKVCLVEGRNNSAPIFSWHQLSMVTICWCVDNPCYGLYLSPPAQVFKQAKAPIRWELGMSQKERESGASVPVSQGAPNKILYHAAVLILSCAIVHTQVHFLLPKAMVLKEEMETTYYSSSTLTTVPGFISEKICLGSTSQFTPKTVHFLCVNK